MIYPVKNPFRITQWYHRGHKAHDIAPKIAGQRGIGLYSPVDGIVVGEGYKRWKWYWPKDQYIQIKGSDGYLYYMGHMVKGSTTRKYGQKVYEGQRVGTMGTTGKSTGIHVHFSIRNSAGNLLGVVNHYRKKGITITSTGAIYPATSKYHTVKRGDTMWGISRAYSINYQKLLGMNSKISNPSLINIGQKVRIK